MRRYGSVAAYEYGHALRQSKSLMIVFLLVILYESVLSPVCTLSAEAGLTLHYTEPFILLCTFSSNVVLIPSVYLFVLSGYPFCTTDYFRMQRLGKRRWFIGELFFLAGSSFAFLLTVLLGSMAGVAKYCTPGNTWSPYMTEMRLTEPELYYRNTEMFLDASTVAHGKPMIVLLYAFCMMWLYLIIIGLLLLLGAVTAHRLPAMITAIGLTVLGGAAIFFGSSLCWLFPLSHVGFGLHFYMIYAKVRFPIAGSVALYLALTAGLTAVCRAKLGTMELGEDI